MVSWCRPTRPMQAARTVTIRRRSRAPTSWRRASRSPLRPEAEPFEGSAIACSMVSWIVLGKRGWNSSRRRFPPSFLPSTGSSGRSSVATYQGVYQMAPTFALAIRAEAGRLFVRATGQSEYELFAESENRFFLRVVDAQGTFLRNKEGMVDRLLWHQGGAYRYCPRVP